MSMEDDSSACGDIAELKQETVAEAAAILNKIAGMAYTDPELAWDELIKHTYSQGYDELPYIYHAVAVHIAAALDSPKEEDGFKPDGVH